MYLKPTHGDFCRSSGTPAQSSESWEVILAIVGLITRQDIIITSVLGLIIRQGCNN
jgi:hypothetical protein